MVFLMLFLHLRVSEKLNLRSSPDYCEIMLATCEVLLVGSTAAEMLLVFGSHLAA